MDEVVRQYGVSKADQKFVASLFERKRDARGAKVRAHQLRIGSSKLTVSKFKMASGKARKTKCSARKIA